MDFLQELAQKIRESKAWSTSSIALYELYGHSLKTGPVSGSEHGYWAQGQRDKLPITEVALSLRISDIFEVAEHRGIDPFLIKPMHVQAMTKLHNRMWLPVVMEICQGPTTPSVKDLLQVIKAFNEICPSVFLGE